MPARLLPQLADTVAAMRFVSTYERGRPRPRNVTAICVANLALYRIFGAALSSDEVKVELFMK